MRKLTFGIFILTIVTAFSFFSIDNAHAAHKLENQHIHVFVNDDGSADITETRQADLSEGTENYIVIEDLGASTIQNFTVTENDQQYEFVKNWDIDASREEKSLKNGIIETSDGYELAWGIGEYGQHEYVLQYTITDFIKQLDDAQILFWQFVNPGTNTPPEQVTIEIEANKPLNKDEDGIWAFGYFGDIHFVDGKVIANSDQPLSSENYMTILVEFAENVFATNDILNRSIADLKEEAFEGSDYDLDIALGDGGDSASSSNTTSGDNGSSSGSIISFILGASSIVIFGGFAIIFIVILIFILSRSSIVRSGKFKRKYKEEYYRDFPYDESFLHVYYIAYTMGIGDFKNLMTALLLKWLKEEKIRMEETEVGMFFKRNETTIYMQKGDMENRSLEGKLFNMLDQAAGDQGILPQKKLSKWAQRNRKRLHDWEKRVRDSSARKLESFNHVTSEEKKILFKKITLYHLTESGEKIEENMYKFINYLHDFSLLHEHEAVNVMIWDEMMIWAGFFGITEEVMQQFKAIYPKYEDESMFNERSVVMATTVATQTNKSRTTSSSSGGGGSASIGGGGGSFGGGSGGGTR